MLPALLPYGSLPEVLAWAEVLIGSSASSLLSGMTPASRPWLSSRSEKEASTSLSLVMRKGLSPEPLDVLAFFAWTTPWAGQGSVSLSLPVPMLLHWNASGPFELKSAILQLARLQDERDAR